MYQVLARKWRPANFEELVGQKHVSRTLANAIESARLAHAYIFAGLRGTGKTTVARILAKCLNCVDGPTPTPCGKCDSCAEIAESRSLDVMEIDAASRTGVDNVRELQELVSYAPTRDRHKIVIIDEAHMLSKASFNALLKTLEEPPPNVLFILATTELGKLLPTIVSRCQVLEFRRVGTRELSDHLRRISDAESIEVTDAGLERIARAGEGSVRDSLSVMERVLAFCGQQVDDDDLLRMLGGVRAEVMVQFLSGLAARDAGAMLRVLDGLIDEGHDLLPFWNELVAGLRDLLLMREIKDAGELLSRSAEEAAALAGATEAMSVQDLTRVFQLIADLEFGLRSSSQPRFLFETALIRLAGLGAVKPIEDVLESLRGGGPVLPAKPSAAPLPRPRRGSPSATPPVQKKNVGASSPAAKLIEAVQHSKPMIAAILEQADEILLDGQALVISFDREHKVLGDRLREPQTVELLRTIAEKVAAGPVNIRIESGAAATPLSPPPAPVPDATKAAPATAKPTATTGAKKVTQSTSERGKLLEQARSEPGVQKLLREFGAQVVDIRPLEIRTPETMVDVEDPS
jgi:DNA polymerase-3 subunit gamma/tau